MLIERIGSYIEERRTGRGTEGKLRSSSLGKVVRMREAAQIGRRLQRVIRRRIVVILTRRSDGAL